MRRLVPIPLALLVVLLAAAVAGAHAPAIAPAAAAPAVPPGVAALGVPPPDSGPAVVGLLVAAALVAWPLRRSRRALALAVVATLTMLSAESSVHSVHHLGQSHASTCTLASASAQLTAALADDVQIVWDPRPAVEPAVDPGPPSPRGRAAEPALGRAPPFPVA